MGDEPGAIYFEYKNIVNHTDFSAVDELHLSLMTQHIYLQADAYTFIHMPRLGEELDVERLALYLPRCLRMHVASYLLTASWVYPLPLFAKLAKALIRLGISCHNSYLFIDECLYKITEVVIVTMTFLLLVFRIRRHLGMQETVQDNALYLLFLLGHPLPISGKQIFLKGLDQSDELSQAA